MKLTLDFSALTRAVQRMDARPVEFSSHLVFEEPGNVTAALQEGIQILDLNEVVAMDGLLTFRGQPILLYIRDHGTSVWKTLNKRRLGNKFHLADCKMLQAMRRLGRFERYVVTNRVDGNFLITGIIRHTQAQVEGEARLRVCQHCLKKLNYKGSGSSGNAAKQSELFDISEYFATYTSCFAQLPRRHAAATGDDAYTSDWAIIAGRIRANRNFRCESCQVELPTHPHLLHVHHRNGVKGDNRPDNLVLLCATCHREQPMHHWIGVAHSDLKIINTARNNQGLLRHRNWKLIKRYSDPALHGVIYACEHVSYPTALPVPELGYTLTDASGSPLAYLDLAWPPERTGVALNREDRATAVAAGWRMFGLEAASDHLYELADHLRSAGPKEI